MRITVVCAPQTSGCNTGMHSVDLAAWHFLQRYFCDANISFISLYPHKCHVDGSLFSYQSVSDYIQLFDTADVILFWGDFLHSYLYREAMLKQLQKQNICESEESAIKLVRSFLYLSDFSDDCLKKVIIYGGTILFNSLNISDNDIYMKDVKRLFLLAKKVWLREPFSAFMVNQIRGKYEESVHGTDCAMLLWLRLNDMRQSKDLLFFQGGSLGIFIGRSHIEARPVVNLVQSLQSSMFLKLSWIDWGTEPFFIERSHEFSSELPELKDDLLKGSSSQEALEQLFSCDIVITDTYHVCVNAWSIGIPAICLIDNSKKPLRVNHGVKYGSRDKRITFLWTYNAAPFLIYSSDLESKHMRNDKVQQLISLLKDKNYIDSIVNHMKKHALASEKLLASCIMS